MERRENHVPLPRYRYLPQKPMNNPQPNSDPLHGITLEVIVTRLVEHFGWATLGKRIKIRCFTHTPSLQSSLKFLRRTPWAREKVETLYLRNIR